MTRVALASAALLELPDTETTAVAGALAERGIDATIEPWDGPADWSSFDTVVIRSTWDYVTRRAEFLGWIARVDDQTTLLNPASVLRWNSHKGYLADLAAAGVPIVPTAFVPQGTEVDDLGAFVADATDCVVKPAVSASAYGTQRGAVDDPAMAEHLRQLVSAGDALVQPVIPSVLTDGEVSVVHLGGELSHAVRKVAKPGDYRVQFEYGGTAHPHTPTADEIALADAAMAAVAGRCAYARIDMVAGPDGPLLMELELIEPVLFLEYAPGAVHRFADVIARAHR